MPNNDDDDDDDTAIELGNAFLNSALSKFGYYSEH